MGRNKMIVMQILLSRKCFVSELYNECSVLIQLWTDTYMYRDKQNAKVKCIVSAGVASSLQQNLRHVLYLANCHTNS